jgi:hypothetical protein
MSNGGILAFYGESLGFELVVESDENVSGAISRMKQRRSRNLNKSSHFMRFVLIVQSGLWLTS